MKVAKVVLLNFSVTAWRPESKPYKDFHDHISVFAILIAFMSASPVEVENPCII